jgi:ketosteroid isomerase-like protein
MTKWILLLLSVAVASAATPDAKTEKEIMATMDAYRQALMHKDAAALGRLLGDDLVYTHSSNLHQDKAALIESLKGDTRYDAIDFHDLKVRVYGNTALVVGDVDFHDASISTGAKTISRLNVLHVLVKGAQGWQIVARQATKYPDPAPDAKK